MSLVKFQDGNSKTVMAPFSELFESFFNDSFLNDRMISRVPAVNVAETNDSYHIELAAPGLKKEDFKINLVGDVLNISAEKKEEETAHDRKYNKREYSYTSFVRSFTLPDTANDADIKAEYTDGILKINVAKKEESKHVSRQIEIK